MARSALKYIDLLWGGGRQGEKRSISGLIKTNAVFLSWTDGISPGTVSSFARVPANTHTHTVVVIKPELIQNKNIWNRAFPGLIFSGIKIIRFCLGDEVHSNHPHPPLRSEAAPGAVQGPRGAEGSRAKVPSWFTSRETGREGACAGDRGSVRIWHPKALGLGMAPAIRRRTAPNTPSQRWSALAGQEGARDAPGPGPARKCGYVTRAVKARVCDGPKPPRARLALEEGSAGA